MTIHSGNLPSRAQALRCVRCDKLHPFAPFRYLCDCAAEGAVLDVVYDWQGLRREDLDLGARQDMWRYRALLPIGPDAILPEISVGATPLSPNATLARQVGVGAVLIKDEGRQPSGSLKDRASAMAVAHAREAGFRTIATASTGNAAAALACLAANAGLHAVVYVPETTPAEKLLSIRAYGAEVILVAGSYDMAFATCLHEARERGWYLRSTAINPLMTEGKKTAAYEICEQLAWRAPEAVFVGVGDGSIIGGLHKGFSDLLALGWIGAMPRIFGVQVAGSNFLYRAWGQQIPLDQVERRSACSIADSLQAEVPQDRFKALDAVTKTAGAYVEVSDDQVLEAMRLMARCGYLVEPAAAAACAGVIRARQQDLLGGRSEAVILSTGNGLKDISSLRRMIAMPSIPK